jgi:hypothetical protein
MHLDGTKKSVWEKGAKNKGEVGSGCLSTTGLVASYNDLFVSGSDIRCTDPVCFLYGTWHLFMLTVLVLKDMKFFEMW